MYRQFCLKYKCSSKNCYNLWSRNLWFFYMRPRALASLVFKNSSQSRTMLLTSWASSYPGAKLLFGVSNALSNVPNELAYIPAWICSNFTATVPEGPISTSINAWTNAFALAGSTIASKYKVSVTVSSKVCWHLRPLLWKIMCAVTSNEYTQYFKLCLWIMWIM